jgi:hypothetical protein
MLKKIKNKIKNFFSPFFKPKKLIIFVLLFSIILGLVLPQSALAVWNPLKSLFGKVKEGIVDATKFHINALLWVGSFAFIGGTGVMLSISLFFFKTVMWWASSISYTENEVVIQGWLIVRDLANMFIVLGFLIVGIATALRIREYEAQKTLVPLIVIALVINFTRLFCGIVIDASNILMDHFLTAGGEASFVGFFHTVTEQIGAISTGEFFSNNPLENYMSAIGFTFINLIGTVVVLLITALFLFRCVALWVLVILSPLAFVCYAFNFSKRYWTMWWNHFLTWCFVGVGGAFFLYLSNRILIEEYIAPVEPGPIPTPIIGPIINLTPYLVPMVLVVVGLLVTLLSGFAVGRLVTSGVGGAGAKAARFGFRALRGTRAGAAVQRAGGRALERLRLAPPGTTAQRQAAIREAGVKRKLALAAEPGGWNKVYRMIDRKRGPSRVESLEAARREKKLRTGDVLKHREELETWGFNVKEFYKTRPDESPNPRETVVKMSPSDFRNKVQIEAYTPEVFGTMSPRQLEGIERRGAPIQKKVLKDLANTDEGKKKLQKYANKLAGEGKKEEWQQLIKNWMKVQQWS